MGRAAECLPTLTSQGGREGTVSVPKHRHIGQTVPMSPPDPRTRAAILLLALGQIIAWAGLYYLFAALLLEWEASFGWSRTELSFALTLALVASAVAAPIVGRLIDRGHGPWLIGGGTFVGGALLALLPAMPTPAAFQILWLMIGLCQATALYEPCFALIARALATGSRGAITTVTLIAGFASSLAFAGAHALIGVMDWQTAVYVFAGAACVIAAPASFIGARLLPRPTPFQNKATRHTNANSRPLTVRFLLIAFAFSMMAVDHGVLLNHLLAILDDRAVTSGHAILAASLIGPMQVVGRVALAGFGRRMTSLRLTMLSFLGTGLAAALLLMGEAGLTLIFAGVILHGAAYGVISIMRPVVTAEILGPDGIARMMGWLALPYLASFAIAPFLGAVIWQIAGYDAVLATLAVVSAMGLGAVALAERLRR